MKRREFVSLAGLASVGAVALHAPRSHAPTLPRSHAPALHAPTLPSLAASEPRRTCAACSTSSGMA